MLTITKIDRATKETKRFMATANAAKQRIEDDRTVRITGCKETGALRRASMDLSRMLVKLRE